MADDVQKAREWLEQQVRDGALRVRDAPLTVTYLRIDESDIAKIRREAAAEALEEAGEALCAPNSGCSIKDSRLTWGIKDWLTRRAAARRAP